MKPTKRKHKTESEETFDGPTVPFEALAALTSSDVIKQVKQGLSKLEPIDHEADFGTEDYSEDSSNY